MHTARIRSETLACSNPPDHAWIRLVIKIKQDTPRIGIFECRSSSLERQDRPVRMGPPPRVQVNRSQMPNMHCLTRNEHEIARFALRLTMSPIGKVPFPSRNAHSLGYCGVYILECPSP